MKKLIISPPFGNWISNPSCTSVLGSFTLEKRKGLIYNVIKTFRPVKGGWINKIGLRNPGIRSIKSFNTNKIYSVVGLEDDDWEKILEIIPPNIDVEVNLGCPNVHEYGIPFKVLQDYCKKFNVIAKLPATENVYEVADMSINAGVKLLHCSNTIPTEKGGISGLQLFDKNIMIVHNVATKYPDKVIAGGGIYSDSEYDLYKRCGASYFSLSTIWMNPFKAIDFINEHKD